MRIVIAAAIALVPYAVLTSVAPHANSTCSMVLDPVSGTMKQICEQYNGPQVANSSVPPCKQGGQICVDCTSALQNAGVTDPTALMQSGYDCASPGASPLMSRTAHCHVMSIATNQVPCSGDIVADPGHPGKAMVTNGG
ncbi:hypothetical protein A5682_19110 [Mycobacterium mantenii]|uniref:Secreted protein n=1 Tax=Mycobacterium mantenii TaxID=560555 RepID=A0A1A2TS11_MYCNT|nr:hypothetical protein A5688_03050 [Mycobacterium mantenii]OBH73143.1 hypothetical protein A5683_25325 [Mycobacterium mantenii]OBH79146.1 hypothetical protein A5682_19110 [Mycobacterium mantenii]